MLSQLPQCRASEVTSLQSAPQSTWSPGGQEQVPSVHVSPEPQAWPHLPQWASFFAVSTQVPPHGVVPGSHSQRPSIQDRPRSQALPQAPQFCSLARRSTQPTPGQKSPGPEAGQAQAPATQIWSRVQASPQPPQLFESVWLSTQRPPHSRAAGSPFPQALQSVRASQSLSKPSPQISTFASCAQAQAFWAVPGEDVHAQLVAGQSASASHAMEHTAPGTPVKVTQSRDAQSSAR